jgi:hypothetical protein
MNRSEFDAELARLQREFGAAEQNLGSFRSERCTGSVHCMFCKGCRNCYRCTHCEDCEATTGSGHCLRCVGCHDCSHCEDAVGCTHSAYLLRCSFCTDCNYCFGCVGLAKKEFHILNQPYARSEYFALLKSLRGDSPVERARNASARASVDAVIQLRHMHDGRYVRIISRKNPGRVLSNSRGECRQAKPAIAMRVRFWGVRGSLPVPGARTERYGGNTSCVEVTSASGTRIIIDGGTGIRRLGKELMRAEFESGKGQAHILVSHTHWDHIQGLPFFSPFYRGGNRLFVYARQRDDQNLRSVFASQADAPFFPVSFDRTRASVAFRELHDGAKFEIEDMQVSTTRLNHPHVATAYAIAPMARAWPTSPTRRPFPTSCLVRNFFRDRPCSTPS